MSAYDLPDTRGHFGPYGGMFVSETLMQPLAELRKAYEKLRNNAKFNAEFADDLRLYVGRPSPLYPAKRLSAAWGGAKIYLKREDLNHTGAHKINNTIGQALLARHMGKTRVIAETGAGQHGVATATVAARFGMQCVVYMGSEDIKRQAINVYRMKLLGAEVVPVESGSKTLKDALNEAMRDWVTNVENTFYIIGSVAGPHPYPMMVRDFQSVIGKEVRYQIMEFEGRLPDALVACVGGGSNAMGLFHPFVDDAEVAMVGVEAAGEGIASGKHAATLCVGRPGVLHGNRTYLLETEDGQIIETTRSPPASIIPASDRACLAQGFRPRALCVHYRPGSAGGVSRTHAYRGHHAGARIGARIGVREAARTRAWTRQGHRGESLRPRRQGHPHGRGH